ncbi:MAG TPA: prolyl oligopeptidase family serine peptidase [Burkholderiales bacterium]|jgi:dienelactone hydrolase
MRGLWVPLVLAVLCAALGGLVLAPTRNDSSYVRDDVRIPVADGHYSLALTIFRPRGEGPFGAIVLNHGVGEGARERFLESPTLFIQAASAFVSRGYVVVMPLRRGFGETGGAFAEDAGDCRSPHYGRGERAAANDVLAAYEFARKLPYVDPERMILAGQSAGGVASLYAAAQRPEGLLAVLAFAAGRGGNPALHPGVPCAAEALAALFQDLGTSVRVPVLMYYAENDLYFGPAASRKWFQRLQSGGVDAEYVLQPPFGTNGHFVFGDTKGVQLWLPTVERFLQRHRIPFELPKQRT